MALKVFVDTDVVISSLISSTSAAFILLNQTDEIDLLVSDKSNEEIEKVIKRLDLDIKKARNLINKRFSIVQLKRIQNLKSEFKDYVLDVNDAHIVAGAKAANAKFLVSYNTRHFKTDMLKEDFNIILCSPGNLLQHLRSQR